MRDIELYRHLLGLELPWTVSRVELSVKEQRVDVWAEHSEGMRWSCPTCGNEWGLYDHSEERAWRHLDSCQFKTFLHARPPRVKCAEHGVVQVRLPWAEPHSRFTALFERFAIDVLRETDVEGATRILRISWDEAWHLMERAVKRGLSRKQQRVIARLGVDEKAAAKGHKYITLVCDLERSSVEYVADDRKQESLDGYFRGQTREQVEGIEAIATDMWEPYVQSILVHVPGAEDKIVFVLAITKKRGISIIWPTCLEILRPTGYFMVARSQLVTDHTRRRSRRRRSFARTTAVPVPSSYRPAREREWERALPDRLSSLDHPIGAIRSRRRARIASLRIGEVHFPTVVRDRQHLTASTS